MNIDILAAINSIIAYNISKSNPTAKTEKMNKNNGFCALSLLYFLKPESECPSSLRQCYRIES